MTTGEIISELLGPDWWEREHDHTALCALFDRVMEMEKCSLSLALGRVLLCTCNAVRPTGSHVSQAFKTALLRTFNNLGHRVHRLSLLVDTPPPEQDQSD